MSLEQEGEPQNGDPSSLSNRHRYWKNRTAKYFLPFWISLAVGLAGVVTAYLESSNVLIRDFGLISFFMGAIVAVSVHVINDMETLEDRVGEVEKTVKDSFKNVNNAVLKYQQTVQESTGIEYTPLRRNIEQAKYLLKGVEEADEIWETSSHKNDDEYEQLFTKALATSSVQARRLVCFNPSEKDIATKMMSWADSMLSNSLDSRGSYGALRSGVQDGAVRISHLDRSLDLDLLIIKKVRENKIVALVGFRTQERSASAGYLCGIYISPHVGGLSLANDLLKLFDSYWREAVRHLQEQVGAPGSELCGCRTYIDLTGGYIDHLTSKSV